MKLGKEGWATVIMVVLCITAFSVFVWFDIDRDISMFNSDMQIMSSELSTDSQTIHSAGEFENLLKLEYKKQN